MSLARANSESNQRGIAHTLNKMRSLAVFIRASPQRRDSFLKIQPGQGLMPLQDVKTRWNSTFLMLRRAKRLRVFITQFCDQFDYQDFALHDDQWRQIDYLLYLTKPFFDFTLALSKTRDSTSHLVFQIYNKLFEHLDKAKAQLERKRVGWKQQILGSLEACYSKLSEYYERTDRMRGHIYPICTMLSPDSRFQFFLSDDWSDAKELRDQYREAFQDALLPIQERLATSNGPEDSSVLMPNSLLYDLVHTQMPRSRALPTNDEMTQYLDGNVTRAEPLSFWKENQFRFPAIALLARDYLAIPATGAGVERLFNTARDICHYRRGSLKSRTIEELMLYLCTSRFDLEIQVQKEFEQFFGSDDTQILIEENVKKPKDVDTDEISDTEEQGDGSDGNESCSRGLIDIDGGSDDGDAVVTTVAADAMAVDAIVADTAAAPSQVRTSSRKRRHIQDDEYQHY
ncbi:hypothetical protein N7523_010125 [Penicillium sp. IBT 18751x]|nr:hypothetical protein N7523_010125 [Penicillium sp. IBT 18751x]